MDEHDWYSEHLDLAVSTGERREGDLTAAGDHSSLATVSFGEEATTSVADLIRFSAEEDQPAPGAASVEPDNILAEFEALAARLSAGAETVNQLCGRVGELFETSAEASRELDAHRERLAAGEEAHRQDHATITRLEAELTARTQAVADMKTRLGDLMRDFETIV